MYNITLNDNPVSKTSHSFADKTGDLGRIVLTDEMKQAIAQAERNYDEGKCLSESEFKQRFAKWL